MNGAAVGLVLLAETFDDPQNARTILLSAAGLVLVGVLIAAGTVWWWRSSEVEHPALGPLEVMSSRSWWKGDYTSRRRRLEAARPEGAEPIDPPATSTSTPVDLEASALASPQEFDDLLEFPPVVPEIEADVESDVEGDADLCGEQPAPEAEAVPAADEPHDNTAAERTAADDTAADDTAADDTAVAALQRPIDPLLRLQHD